MPTKRVVNPHVLGSDHEPFKTLQAPPGRQLTNPPSPMFSTTE